MGRSSTEWLCVWLRSLEDRLSEGGVEEHIRVIGRILGLKETSEFRAGGSLLAKYRIPVRGGIGGEILARKNPYVNLRVLHSSNLPEACSFRLVDTPSRGQSCWPELQHQIACSRLIDKSQPEAHTSRF
jgi:hypothetical protein